MQTAVHDDWVNLLYNFLQDAIDHNNYYKLGKHVRLGECSPEKECL